MGIVYGPVVGQWVGRRVRGHFDESDSQALGWECQGTITAGVIYEAWNGASILAHIACDAPLVKGFVWCMFDYPFRQLGAMKIMAPVGEGNAASARLVTKLGFKEEGRITDGHPSGDLVIYTMRQDDCRWTKELNHGKRLRGRFSPACS